MNTEGMLDSLRKSISSRLSYKRFIHTVGVEDTALFLAELCLPEKAYELRVAALLHDVSKEMPIAEQIKLLEERGITLTEDDYNSPGVIHSYTAPIVASKLFGSYCSSEILSAIGKHTLGDDNMSVFDEIIFIADYLEPSRCGESFERVREHIFKEMRPGDLLHNVTALHFAIIMQISSTVSYLKSIGEKIHPKTLETLNSIEKKYSDSLG